jgi:hypothetical protein
MKPNRLNDLLLVVFFVGVFIQNATISIGTVQIGSILLPMGLFVLRVMAGGLPVVRTGHFRPVMLFLGYVLLRMFTSPHTGEALVVMVYFLLDALVMVAAYTFVLYALRNRRQDLVVRSVNAIMLCTVLIYAFVFVTVDTATLGQHLMYLRDEGVRAAASFFDPMSYVIVENRVMRLNGFYLDPNYWSLYALVGLYIVVLLSPVSGTGAKSGGWMYLRYLPAGLSMLLTFSRGAILGILLLLGSALGRMILENPRQGAKVLVRVGVGLGVLGPLALYGIFDSEQLRQLLFEKTVSDMDNTYNARPFIWLSYLTIYAGWGPERLLFGMGLNRLYFEDVGFFISAHNLIFQLLGSLGFVGVVLYLYTAGHLTAVLARARRRAMGTLRSPYFVSLQFLAVLLLLSLFEDPMFHFPYWLFMGVALGMVRYHELWPATSSQTDG